VERAIVVTPSLARATLAVLQRPGFSAPSGSAPIPSEWDDIPAPPQAVAAHESGPSPDIGPILRRVESVEREVITLGNQTRRDVETLTGNQGALKTAVQSLTARVDTLEKQAPAQFVINGVTSPIVEGQHYLFPEMVQWLEMGFHALLVGPASSGKTSAAFAFAKLKGLKLYSQPQTTDSFGILGYLTPNGERVETEFTRAWLEGGVYLIDEASTNGADALSCLNAALANRRATIPGLGVMEQHADFYCIAGDNSDTGATLQYSARQLLDGATLDRFVRLQWEIDPIIESSLCPDFPDWLACVRAIRAFIAQREIAHVGATVRSVIQGATALRATKLPRRAILEATCAKGILRAEWASVLQLPAVQSFLKG
jgi:hypothetical protein